MERIKNIIILTIEVLVVIAIIVFVAIYIAASSTEKSYQKAADLIKSKHYKEAVKVLEKIPHYKDSSELYVYIYPNDLYYQSYKSETEMLNGFKEALSYIDTMKDNLKIKKYRDSFEALKKTINFRMEEIAIKKENDSANTVLNSITDLIKKGDYIGAGNKLSTLTNPNFEPVKNELTSYIIFLNSVNLNDKNQIKKSAASLDPNYTGILSTDIKNAVLLQLDINEWTTIYNANKVSNTNSKATSVTIGMKRDEVITALGQPIKDEKISNEYGSFERMTYTNNNVLYLQKDIVDAFK